MTIDFVGNSFSGNTAYGLLKWEGRGEGEGGRGRGEGGGEKYKLWKTTWLTIKSHNYLSLISLNKLLFTLHVLPYFSLIFNL